MCMHIWKIGFPALIAYHTNLRIFWLVGQMARILYCGNKNASTWAMRAWLALREAGLEFEERAVELRPPQRAIQLAEIGRFSPPAAVPVLVDDGAVIFDSMAIMEYANDLSGGVLLPADIQQRAQARAFAAWVHAGLSGLCSQVSFEAVFYPQSPVFDAQGQAEAQRLCQVWEQQLQASGGPYLFSSLSLADLALTPTLLRLQSCLGDFKNWPLTQAWATQLLQRPAVQEWMTAAKALEPVWE